MRTNPDLFFYILFFPACVWFFHQVTNVWWGNFGAERKDKMSLVQLRNNFIWATHDSNSDILPSFSVRHSTRSHSADIYRYFTQKVSTFQTARLYQHLRGLKKILKKSFFFWPLLKNPQTLFENISTGHFQSMPCQTNRWQYNGQPEGFNVQTFRTFLLANQMAGTCCFEFRNPCRLTRQQ